MDITPDHIAQAKALIKDASINASRANVTVAIFLSDLGNIVYHPLLRLEISKGLLYVAEYKIIILCLSDGTSYLIQHQNVKINRWYHNREKNHLWCYRDRPAVHRSSGNACFQPAYDIESHEQHVGCSEEEAILIANQHGFTIPEELLK